MIYGALEDSMTEKRAHHGAGKEATKEAQSRVTIGMLPDVVLLEIFDLYVYEERTEAWFTLVHVCRKWRHIVFGSPSRLNLRLFCGSRTPVRGTLDVWPLLPIIIRVHSHEKWAKWGVENIVAALEHTGRVCRISLFDIPSSQLEKFLAATQQPFPALTILQLRFEDETALVVPASFLGESAQGLQTLWLDRIPFPGLPKLLLSAIHLVDLDLWRIPHSGYIPPEAMATCLSASTRLEKLDIRFESPQSCPDQKSRRPPPQTRTLLPVLAELRFKGVGEYLEDLVARIDAPLLDNLGITFFHRLTFDTPQLTQFITRTPKFKLNTHVEAHVVFSDWDVSVTLPRTFGGAAFELTISCRQSDWQLSSLAQACGSSSYQALIPTVENLYIQSRFSQMQWQDDIESSQWLEFFYPFATVKGLYLSQEFSQRIAPTLQDLVRERVIEVLPALQTLFLEDALQWELVPEAIKLFVAARRYSGHPIAVSGWER